MNWDKLYERYRKRIEEAESEKEFYKISAEFVSNLKGGHLSFRYNSREIREKIIEHYNDITYPMDIRFIENKPIVVQSLKDFDIKGT